MTSTLLNAMGNTWPSILFDPIPITLDLWAIFEEGNHSLLLDTLSVLGFQDIKLSFYLPGHFILVSLASSSFSSWSLNVAGFRAQPLILLPFQEASGHSFSDLTHHAPSLTPLVSLDGARMLMSFSPPASFLKMYTFNMYNFMIWYMFNLCNNHHNQAN